MRTANGSEKQPAIELFNFDTVMNTQYSEKPPNRTYTNKESEELRHLTFQNIKLGRLPAKMKEIH